MSNNTKAVKTVKNLTKLINKSNDVNHVYTIVIHEDGSIDQMHGGEANDLNDRLAIDLQITVFNAIHAE